MVKCVLRTIVRVVGGAVIYYAGFLLGSLIAGWVGIPAPELPPGTDAATLGLYQLAVSLISVIVLAALARYLAGRFLLRWGTLALFAWVAYGLNTYLEAVIFTAYGSASAYTLVMQGSAILGSSAAVAWWFGPRSAQRPDLSRAIVFLGQHTVRGWLWRILVLWIAFPIIYLVFGWLVQPFVIEFYREQMAGLTLPGWGQILPVQGLRSLLFLLACIPVALLWRGSRRGLFWHLGGALFAFVGGLYMLQAYWYPITLRVAVWRSWPIPCCTRACSQRFCQGCTVGPPSSRMETACTRFRHVT